MSLAVEPSEIGRLRRSVTTTLKSWGLGDLAGDVALVVGELLANVHKHAESVGALEILVTGELLIVKVSDTIMTPPVLSESSPSAETGRGLLLVEALTERWETVITPTGKVVVCTFRDPRLISREG